MQVVGTRITMNALFAGRAVAFDLTDFLTSSQFFDSHQMRNVAFIKHI